MNKTNEKNKMKDSFKMAYRNLIKRKKRAVLTIIGIFIGISAVVALVSLGQGLQKTINDQFERVGADKIMVMAKEVGFGGQNVQRPLTETEIDIIDNANGIKQVAGSLFIAGNVQFNDLQKTQYVVSLPKNKKEAELIEAFNIWEADDGRLLTHKDSQKAVVGYNLGYKKAFQENVRVGDKILVNGDEFKVVGILNRIGDPTMDNGVILSEEDARRVLDEPKIYSYIVAQTISGVNPEDVAKRIEKILRRNRNLDEGKEDFNVQTSTELIASFNMVLNIIQVVFVGIAAISLLVGGIGITNTMYTSVLERTNEIGVMKAIGAQNKDVMAIFLIESGILGFVGGLVGILFGVFVSKIVEIGANSAFGPGTIYAAYPFYLIFGALFFSMIVGGLSGVLPALRASKLKPVDALRYE